MNKIIDQNGKGVLQEAVCNRCKCDCYDYFKDGFSALPKDANGFIPQLIAPPGVGKAFWREGWKEINSLEYAKWEEQNDETKHCYFRGAMKMNKSKFVPIYALLITILLLSSSCQGADYAKKEELYIEYKQPAQVTISSTGINRISIAPFIATTIWGDSAEYSALLSHNGSELFLTSKLEASKSFALALQLAGGRVIDLLLHTVEADRPKIVRLELQDESLAKLEETLEIKQLLNAMMSKQKGKYYVTQMKKVVKINAEGNEIFAALNAEQNMVYRFGNFVGVVLKLKNKGKKEVSVDAKSLAKSFKGVLAVSLHNQLLKSGGSMEAFLVLRRRS